jgi:hypothetical protein
VTDVLERIWKEPVVILRYYLDSRLQNHEKQVRIASLRAEIRLFFVLFSKYYYDDQIKKDEKGGSRSANGRYKEYTQNFSRKTVKGRDQPEDICMVTE